MSAALAPSQEPLILRLGDGSPGPPPVAYRLAGCAVVSDRPVPELEPFRAEPGKEPEDGAGGRRAAGFPERTFSGTGWISGRRVAVDCRASADGYRLAAGDAGVFQIDAKGKTVELVDRGPERQLAVGEALAGPVLILALAARGIFCLHAAAVQSREGAHAFAGSSGAGKSTLAAALPALWPGGRRLADDVLPLTLTGDGAVVLPEFPQLKLPGPEQRRSETQRRVPVAGLYVLAPVAGAASPELRPLRGARAVAAIIENTLANALFASHLKRQHLELAAHLTETGAVRELRYPHAPEAIAAVARLLGG